MPHVSQPREYGKGDSHTEGGFLGRAEQATRQWLELRGERLGFYLWL